MAPGKISQKLLVETKSVRVLFAEVGKEFKVHRLHNLLTLPIGVVTRLVHGSVASTTWACPTCSGHRQIGAALTGELRPDMRLAAAPAGEQASRAREAEPEEKAPSWGAAAQVQAVHMRGAVHDSEYGARRCVPVVQASLLASINHRIKE
jgi:hypothetical protein